LNETFEENEFKAIFTKNFAKFHESMGLIYESLKAKLEELRFFKMQVFRSGEKEEKKSEFDPRMLFSQEDTNVRKALEALLKTPMNNFLVHYNNTGVEMSDLLDEITKTLMINKSMFGMILDFQKSFSGNNEEIKKMAEKLDLDQFEEELQSNSDLLTKEQEEKNEKWVYFNRILKFLVSLTWKDLGIIINFVMDEGRDEINKVLLKCGFIRIEGPIKGFYKFGLIDMKLKGIQKLLEFDKTQRKVNEIFVSNLINSYVQENQLD